MSDWLTTEFLSDLRKATPEQISAIKLILRSAPASEDAHATEVAGRNVFRRAGSHWDVRFEGGEVFHLEDTLGARYLAHLLQHPGEVISAFDLEVAICPDKANARARDSIQEQLDPETVRSYMRELSRLRVEREAATEDGDAARVERLDQEIEAVEAALRGSGGDGGDAGERARGNVRKAIGKLRLRLSRGSQEEREFARHLLSFVSTGYECVYRQPRSRAWEG